jgi:hypothetical protein
MAPDDHRPPSSLYEEDFFLWTQEQAAALRARGKGGVRIDYETLAEEVEDLGRRERRECMSRTATILEHLFKLAWSQQVAPRGGWEATIITQRADLLAVLTPSLRRDVEASLDDLHRRAAEVAVRLFKSDEPGATCDVGLRWSLAQILGESDDPIG